MARSSRNSFSDVLVMQVKPYPLFHSIFKDSVHGVVNPCLVLLAVQLRWSRDDLMYVDKHFAPAFLWLWILRLVRRISHTRPLTFHTSQRSTETRGDSLKPLDEGLFGQRGTSSTAV